MGVDVASWKFQRGRGHRRRRRRRALYTHEHSHAEHTINTRVYLEYFSKNDTAARFEFFQYRQTWNNSLGETSGYTGKQYTPATLTDLQTNILLCVILV